MRPVIPPVEWGADRRTCCGERFDRREPQVAAKAPFRGPSVTLERRHVSSCVRSEEMVPLRFRERLGSRTRRRVQGSGAQCREEHMSTQRTAATVGLVVAGIVLLVGLIVPVSADVPPSSGTYGSEGTLPGYELGCGPAINPRSHQLAREARACAGDVSDRRILSIGLAVLTGAGAASGRYLIRKSAPIGAGGRMPS